MLKKSEGGKVMAGKRQTWSDGVVEDGRGERESERR